MTKNINESEKKADLGTEGSDIWKEILSESITKKDYEEANIFVFGDKSTGKKSLIRLMNKEFSYYEGESKRGLNIEEEAAKYGLMNYTHLSIKKNDEDSDIKEIYNTNIGENMDNIRKKVNKKISTIPVKSKFKSNKEIFLDLDLKKFKKELTKIKDNQTTYYGILGILGLFCLKSLFSSNKIISVDSLLNIIILGIITFVLYRAQIQ